VLPQHKAKAKYGNKVKKKIIREANCGLCKNVAVKRAN
jgi:hypothetical protein